MPDNTYKDIDPDVVKALLDDNTPWEVIEQITGASRLTVIKRLEESGYHYEKRGPGRRKAISDELRAKAVQWSREGISDSEIATRLHVSPSTVGICLNEADPGRQTDLSRKYCGELTVREVLELFEAGIPVADIAGVASVGVTTVYYHLRKHGAKAGAPE